MYKHKRLSTLRVRYFKELDIFNNLFSIAKLLKNTIEVEKVKSYDYTDKISNRYMI